MPETTKWPNPTWTRDQFFFLDHREDTIKQGKTIRSIIPECSCCGDQYDILPGFISQGSGYQKARITLCQLCLHMMTEMTDEPA